MLYVTLSVRSIVYEITKQIYVHGDCRSTDFDNFFSRRPCFSVELVLRCLQDTIRNDIHKPKT
jgi:hypothetical protein